jgi:hypothetical protein
VLLFLLMAVPSIGQTPPVGRTLESGVKIGLALTNLSNVSTLVNTSIAAGFEPTISLGGFLTIPVSGRVGFQLEAALAAKGQRIRDPNATISAGTPREPQADRVVLLKYLEFPLLMRLSTAGRAGTSLYVLGGPAIGFRLGAVSRTVADAGVLNDIEALIKGTDFGLMVGGGIQHNHVLVEGRVTKGLQNVALVPAPGEVKTRSLAVIVGVRF